MRIRAIHPKTLLTVLLLLIAVCGGLGACRHAGAQRAATSVQNAKYEVQSSGFYALPLADRAEQLLYRKAYVVSYNRDWLQPNWVGWHLTKEHTYGDVPRPATAWHEDHDVPQPRVRYQDYRGTAWDRGHLCPAGDNKWDETAMYESFLMSNASPQNKAFNSGVWNDIEQTCRRWARKWGDIHIVCGPLFLNQEHDSVGPNRIPVPEAFFKVIADLNPDHPKGIAFVCRNNEGKQKKDLYTNSIADVERLTGITFFPTLPVDLAEQVKRAADIKQW